MTDAEAGPADISTLPSNPQSLPTLRLLAFTAAGFLAITTETIPAGLLPRIGQGLGVSESLVGQFVTSYALGAVVAAVPVIAATRGMRRRPVLISAIAGLLVFNAVTALSTSYHLTLATRFLAGMAAGVVWGVLVGYARRLVPERLQGRALAVVGVGQPVALTLGIPLGTLLGGLVGWRGVFWIISGVSLALLAWIRTLVPDLPGQKASARRPITSVATLPGVRPVLLVVLLWILAHNVLYTYISPYLDAAGLGGRVDAVLFVFGSGAIVGIWWIGALVDRAPRAVTLASLGGFAVAALLLGIGSHSAPAAVIGVACWGITFGGAPTLMQTALADAAGEDADIAQSMLVTVFNLAVAGGGAVGALLLDAAGATALPWVLLTLSVAGGAVVLTARAHGFPPGGRRGS
ncbi:MFS transporter [Streptomyces sp. NRRL B-1347]|uniref:MFS transporter n=1 Tax=Streptomyces sp. NRRL B-1347 TaxID=1476877 RepID=UPI001F4211C3|nr:MFS transporter [Streptomyces sp. NRRL B-1347]